MTLQFLITTQAPQVDDISNELMLLGACSITLLDAADDPCYEPAPGEIILWPQVVIVALVTDETLIPAFQTYLTNLLSQQMIQTFRAEPVPDNDWVRMSLDQFHPTAFGKRLWICPSWLTPPDHTAVNVMLDPGLAFGTGTHPTTSLCLRWLDEHIRGGETLIDYGCGSGILGIAAIRLGAARVIAIDHDPQALEATRMNAQANSIHDKQLQVTLPDDYHAESQPRVDILLANILANPLIELAPLFAKLIKPNGKIVLSGILREQSEMVVNAYQAWCTIAEPVYENEWVRLEAIVTGKIT